MAEADVVVIGSGPAGFLAAQTASQLGGKVIIVEKERLGGVCVNWGCIPMCFLTRCAGILKLIKEVKQDGIETGPTKIDFIRLVSKRDQVIQGVIAGMETRLQETGVQVIRGTARLTSPGQVEIEAKGGSRQTIQTKKIIIAAGSFARRYDIPGAYGAGVLTAKELLDLKEIPKSLIIIGRGATALELATVWFNLGSAVTLITRKPQLLPGEDEELAASIKQILKNDGIHLYFGVDIERIDNSSTGKSVTISQDGIKQKVNAQFVVFALGQQPYITGLGLENTGLDISERRIRTNDKMETGVKGIYGAGDVTGGMMLANVAMVQGAVAGENAMGRLSTMDYRVVPRFVRTLPPMASVGINEKEAKTQGIDFKIGRFSFDTNPKAGILREGSGFVKVVADSTSKKILGVHIIGPEATELIHEAVVTMKMGGSARDLAGAMPNHPCLHETIQRAAQSLCL